MLGSIFDAVESFHQAGFLVGSTLLLGIAAAIFADFFHWRIVAREFAGEIVALRASRGQDKGKKTTRQRVYFPVIEYLADDGRRMRAHTFSGSSRLVNKLPGKRVRILVKPGEEDVARVKGLGPVVFGALFAGFGLLLLAIALTQYRFSFWTVPCFLAMVAFAAFKLLLPAKKRTGEGRSRVEAVRAWKRRKHREALEECEEIEADEAHRLAAQQGRATRKAAPVFGLVSLGMMAGGYYVGQGVLSLETEGLSAVGEIVRIEARQGQDSEGRQTTTYYPVVGFQSAGGQQIEFTSRFGSSSTSYRRGDRVDVLYSPLNPREDAMIDRGAWNWLLPGGLSAAGLLAFCASVSSYLAARRRESGRAPPRGPVSGAVGHGQMPRSMATLATRETPST
jgi:hypothetical protein